MKKLAILGASYLQKPLVDKANSMGIETHCFAWDNEEAVCKFYANYFYPISVLDKELILQNCHDISVNGIVTIATDICIPTIAFVAEKMNLTSNSYHSALLSTNKAMMREAFLENNVNSPKFKSVSCFALKDFTAFLFPLIVKPTDRSGSRGVTKVENTIELEAAITRGLEESFEKKVIVEEYIDGVEVSVEAISWKGEHKILAITDKVTTGAPYFVELEHHQPSLLSNDIQESIRQETVKALNALQIEYGASHSEFRITKLGSVYAIEVGARMGGDFIGSHLVELSTGYDFVKAVIEVSLGKFDMPEVKSEHYSGVYFLSKQTKDILPIIEQKGKDVVQAEILNSNLIEVTNSSERSGYFIYKSNKRFKKEHKN